MIFTVWGDPIPKPRMTRSDKWKRRDCVLQYRAWCDAARLAAKNLPANPSFVYARAFIAIPLSRTLHVGPGSHHRQTPDADNLLKAVLDALWPDGDQGIHAVALDKFWDDGKGPRVEIEIH